MAEPFEIVKVRTRVKKWDTKPGWYMTIPIDWLDSARTGTVKTLQITRDYKQMYNGLIQIKYGCIEITDELAKWIHAVYPQKGLQEVYLFVEVTE